MKNCLWVFLIIFLILGNPLYSQLKNLDPTNKNSKLRKTGRDIDPTNKNSTTRKTLREIDAGTRKALRDFDEHVIQTLVEELKNLILPQLFKVYIDYLERQASSKKRLPDDFIQVVAKYYRSIDLHNVRYAENINTIHGQAITIENTIYFTEKIDFKDPSDLNWMLHELEHVVQYNKVGLCAFLERYICQAAVRIATDGSFNVHDSVGIEKEADAKADRIFNDVNFTYNYDLCPVQGEVKIQNFGKRDIDYALDNGRKKELYTLYHERSNTHGSKRNPPYFCVTYKALDDDDKVIKQQLDALKNYCFIRKNKDGDSVILLEEEEAEKILKERAEERQIIKKREQKELEEYRNQLDNLLKNKILEEKFGILAFFDKGKDTIHFLNLFTLPKPYSVSKGQQPSPQDLFDSCCYIQIFKKEGNNWVVSFYSPCQKGGYLTCCDIKKYSFGYYSDLHKLRYSLDSIDKSQVPLWQINMDNPETFHNGKTAYRTTVVHVATGRFLNFSEKKGFCLSSRSNTQFYISMEDIPQNIPE